MKTLYIHIGTGKTGTSAIQEFCANNCEILKSKGYGYPIFPFQYGYTPKNHNGYFLRADNMEDKESGFWKCIDIIDNLFNECPNVVLSDEGIWRASIKWHKQLFEITQQKGYNVKLIVYFRRQDEYLISRWKQFVKWGYFVDKHREQSTAGDFVDDGGTWESFYKKALDDPKMDYGNYIIKLENIYGKDNIIVRRYDYKAFYNGSVCADFLHTLNLELTDEYEYAEAHVNGSLSPNTAEIKRILNTMPGIENYDNHQFFQKLLLSFSDESSKKYPCSMFSDEELTDFMEHFKEGNKRIAKEYFGDEVLFHIDEHSNKPKWEKNNPYMQDDIIRFVGGTLMRIMDENKKLQKEMRSVKEFKNKVKHPLRTIKNKIKKD